ncbi:phytepsin-like [Drosophila rhopaloa]|uniref:Peptidase A1 domain-containing protein n=1 Tax=Drosophila rhopaloa TaxID=1041015 RepID=A0ABM5JBC7_DRORH|nr:phytepsin-like [Drosophila rhopaloa]
MNLRVIILLLSLVVFVAGKVHRFRLQRRSHRHHKVPQAHQHLQFRNALRRKYGFTPLRIKTSQSRASKGEVVSENLIDAYNTNFFGEVSVGGQPFTMLFDTGSSDFWVPSSHCQVCITKCGNRFFNESKSKTFHTKRVPFSIQYGSGAVQGIVGSDDVGLGDLKIRQQGLGLVNITDSCDAFDGIGGMGFPPLSETRSKPLFQQMIDQKLVEQPIFSFHLKSGSSDGGSMILGGSNSSLYYGYLTYTNVIEATYWTFKMDFIEVHGKGLRGCVGGCKAIMDTGTSLIVGPALDILLLNNAIGARHNSTYDLYIVDCSSIPKLPTIVLGIANKKFYITPQTYVIVFEDMCFTGFNDLRGLTFWIIGDVFIRENYVEFDWARKRIGIARAAEVD